MYNYIKQFFGFLFPIFRTTVVQIAADTLYEIAYPNDRRDRRGTGYRRYTPASGRYGRQFNSSIFEQAARRSRSTVEELEETYKDYGKTEEQKSERFHDVLMVAFDITGPNAAVVSEWLSNHMPAARGYETDDINIDAWWIADDIVGDSDCDSAIFVAKGNQVEARRLLRQHGLVS
jgi:hypothetical protein